MPFRALLLTLLVVGAAVPVSAQHRLAEGTYLRIQVQESEQGPVQSMEGTLAYSPNGFSLHVSDPAADGRIIDTPLRNVTRVELPTERNRLRSARNGAGFMAFLGTSLGLIAGPIIASTSPEKDFGPIVAKSTAVGFGAGVLIGGAAGALMAKDGWQRYTVPPEWR